MNAIPSPSRGLRTRKILALGIRDVKATEACSRYSLSCNLQSHVAVCVEQSSRWRQLPEHSDTEIALVEAHRRAFPNPLHLCKGCVLRGRRNMPDNY